MEHRISEWLNSQLPQGSWESVASALTSGTHPLFKQFFYDLKHGQSELITNEIMNKNIERREREPEAWKTRVQNVGVAWKKN